MGGAHNGGSKRQDGGRGINSGEAMIAELWDVVAESRMRARAP